MASAAAAKKWPRLFQGCGLVAVHQPQIGLVDQGRGLERLAGLLLGQLLGGQLAQLVVDQRQELLGGVRVALLDGGQDARDVGHKAPLRRGRSVPSYPMGLHDPEDRSGSGRHRLRGSVVRFGHLDLRS